MVKGSIVRKAEHPVDRLFLDRWSPRAMSGQEIPASELMILCEAARWAPSSSNLQPWRILYARRGTPHWATFFDLLADGNKSWCVNAAALFVFVSQTTDKDGDPARTHSYDTGSAWMSFALQGSLRGLVVHGMAGFDYDRARQVLKIPVGYEVEAMAAVGRPGDKEKLSESQRKRENPSDRRKLGETVTEGPWA